MQKIKAHCGTHDFQAYLASEIKLMLAEVQPVCPVESPEFNGVAIAWIEKNAARFRRKWERYHNGRKEYVIVN